MLKIASDGRRGVTVVATTIEFWNDIPLKKIFEEKFEVPTVVESRTRATAIAERMLGSGEMQQNLVYFDYGTGFLLCGRRALWFRMWRGNRLPPRSRERRHRNIR